MVPQEALKNNRQVWRELEEATRAVVTKQKQDVYVITGPSFNAKRLKTIGQGVIVPTAVYKAVYMPKTGAIGAYYAPNNDSLQVQVVSVCYLEEQLGINLFPQLSEEQKRNTYKLPLTANAVEPIHRLPTHIGMQKASAQKMYLLSNYKPCKPNLNTSGSSPASGASIDADTQDAIVKQLIEALLQYILQLLKS